MVEINHSKKTVNKYLNKPIIFDKNKKNFGSSQPDFSKPFVLETDAPAIKLLELSLCSKDSPLLI